MRTAIGTYTEIIQALSASTSPNFLLEGSSTTVASVDNVSVKQVTSASNQIQKREVGTGAFGPTPVGAYLPLTGGTLTGA